MKRRSLVRSLVVTTVETTILTCIAVSRAIPWAILAQSIARSGQFAFCKAPLHNFMGVHISEESVDGRGRSRNGKIPLKLKV